MVETTATLKLHAIDTNVTTTIGNISTNMTNATLATTALAAAFGGLEKVVRTSQAQMAIGTEAAHKLAGGLSVAADANSRLAKTFGVVGTYVFYGQQLAILGEGVAKATDKFVRLPQTLQAMQASGVTTRTVEDFANLAEAIKGSDIALESLLTSSISELGRFEAAAARAGTILKSSFRLNEAGLPDRANAEERMANALSVQRLVNDELGNAVTSTQALLGQYEVLSAGFTSAAESQTVLTSGLKLIGIAEAGGVTASPTETLQLLTKTLNAYELSASDAAKTAAILNAVVENGLTTIPQLSLGFGAMSKQAQQANIALEDSGAAISVLTSQGISTPEAMTGIARLSANIINKTPEAEKALGKLQLRGEKIRFDKAEIQAKGFTQALVDLNDAAGGSAEVLAKIFPEDVAFRTATALLAEQGRKLIDTRNSISQATAGSLEEVFEIAQSDRTKRFERIANRFREIVIKVGMALADTLEPGLSALEKIADKFNNLPEPIKENIGRFLAFKIATKASTSALGELIKALGSLVVNYLSVRLISLALTGQLGNEFKTIKSLISQRHGLAAATLQLFGINQKWRLSTEAATAAVSQQGKVAAVVSKSTAKAAQTAQAGIVAGMGKLSGITAQQAKESLQKTATTAVQVAKTVADKGKELAKAAATKIPIVPPADSASAFTGGIPRVAYGGNPQDRTRSPGQSTVVSPPAPTRPAFVPPLVPTAPARPAFVPPLTPPAQARPAFVPPLIPVAPKPFEVAKPLENAAKQAAQTVKPQPIKPFQFVPLKVSEARSLAQESQTILATQLDNLVSKDREIIAATQKKELALAESKRNLQARNVTKQEITKAGEARTKAQLALSSAQNKAIATSNDLTATAAQKQSALADVTKKQQALKQANLRLADAELKYQQLNTEKLIQRNRAIEASTSLEQKRIAARARYAPLAKALTELEQANTKAIALGEAATIAKLKADQIATAEGYKSAAAIQARNAARIAEARATKAATVLEQQKAAVDKINTSLLHKQQLAEMGLYEARIFGNKVRLASTGVMGAINKLLTANIGLSLKAVVANTKLAFSEANLAKIRAFFTNPTDLRFLSIWAQQSNLLALNVKGLATALKTGLFGAAAKAGSGISTLLQPLGALAPLAIAGAGAAVVLRNELFGLGAEVRKLNKDYKEYLEAQRKLNAEIGRETGLSSLSKLAEGSPTAFRDKLLELKDSGAITQAEFSRLSTSIDGLGNAGEKNKEKLADLRREIDEIVLSSGQKVEKGVVSSMLSGIKAIPGAIGSVVDFSANTIGAISGSAVSVFTKGRLTGIGETAQNREADLLIENLSKLGLQADEVGNRYVETSSKIQAYRENLALTSTVQTKVARGEKLTTEDLKAEELAFKNIERQNNQEIQELEDRIAKEEEALAKVKNEENKQIYRNNIESARAAKQALEEQNTELKQQRSATQKYLIEELPKIRTALQESSDPTLALTNAREKFEQAYLEDAEGRTTKLLKPLQVLRDEAFKLAAQTTENLQLGALDGAKSGEIAAAEALKKIRDNQIEFMENGELKRGYRLVLADRKAFTEQIVQLENAELKRREARTNIEIEQIRAVGQARLSTEADTNLKISQLQQQQTLNRIAQKEKEIAEFQRLGLRTVDLEIELESLRVQARAQSLQNQLAKINKLVASAELRVAELETKNAAALNSSKLFVQALNRENKVYGANTQYIQQQLSAIEKRSSLITNISGDQIFNAQVQADLEQARQKTLIASIPYQEKELENQIEITQEQNKQNLLQSQSGVERAKLALFEAEEQLRFARRNQADRDRLTQLKQTVKQQKLQLEQAYDAVDQAEFQIGIQDELARRQREQLNLEQQAQIYTSRFNSSRAELAIVEAEISRQLQLQQTALTEAQTKIEINSKRKESLSNFRTGELGLALQLTNDEKEKLKIAKTIAAIKLKSLNSQLVSEAQILAINQQQEKVKLRSEKSKNRAALSQNLADTLKATAELEKLQASGASPQEIKAAQAAVTAQLAQRASLQFQSQQLDRQGKLQELSQKQQRESFRRSAKLQIDQARVSALEVLPEDERKGLAGRLKKEFLRRGGGAKGQDLKRLIIDSGKFNLRIPELKIPPLEFPDIEKIRQDVHSIVSEFRKENNQPLNTKSFTIQNLNLDSPINININGAEDKEEIAQAVEGAVFNRMTDVLRGVEAELNS